MNLSESETKERDGNYERKDKIIRRPRVPEKTQKEERRKLPKKYLNSPRTERYELLVERIHPMLSRMNNFLKDPPTQGTL